MKAQSATIRYTGFTGFTGLTRGQIRWASTFDWFVDWYARDGILCVLVRTEDNELREFTCFESLRAWAAQ